MDTKTEHGLAPSTLAFKKSRTCSMSAQSGFRNCKILGTNSIFKWLCGCVCVPFSSCFALTFLVPHRRKWLTRWRQDPEVRTHSFTDVMAQHTFPCTKATISVVNVVLDRSPQMINGIIVLLELQCSRSDFIAFDDGVQQPKHLTCQRSSLWLTAYARFHGAANSLLCDFLSIG